MGEGRRRRITIAGAGPGGICTAIKLKEAGIEDFLILERSSPAGRHVDAPVRDAAGGCSGSEP